MYSVKSDGNGGSSVGFSRIKPGVIRVAIPLSALLTIIMMVGSMIWVVSARSKTITELELIVAPLPEKVEGCETSIQENRRMMNALLKQLVKLCEKQGVEILYETEDFFDDK